MSKYSIADYRSFRRSNFLVDQQFGYVRLAAPLLDIVGISTEYCGDQYSVIR